MSSSNNKNHPNNGNHHFTPPLPLNVLPYAFANQCQPTAAGLQQQQPMPLFTTTWPCHPLSHPMQQQQQQQQLFQNSHTGLPQQLPSSNVSILPNLDVKPSSKEDVELQLQHGSCDPIPPPANTTMQDPSPPAPFKKGQSFPSEANFKASVEAYALATGIHVNWKTTSNKRAQSDPYVMYRASCPRSGKYTSKKNMNSSDGRPTRNSLKCDCDFQINAAHDKMPNNKTNAESVSIVSLNLEHTNGCEGGADPDTSFALKKRGGRKYPEFALDHLRKEVLANRYGTHEVKSWLVDAGFSDATLEEATNLRYRLRRGLTIKDWKPNECSDEEMGEMQDYLFNDDLAKEVVAGSKQSIDNLQLVHNGLREQIDGYAFEMATDSENRFSGTAWQTGRMRARLEKHGVMIFLDDTRSGVNTSNFCFWNVMVVDHEGKTQTVMGAMTMCASYDAVKWVLDSLVSMSPFASTTIKATMSDLGTFHMLLPISHSLS